MKLLFPSKVAYRDSYRVEVTNINVARRYLSQPFGVNWAQDPNLYLDLGMRGHDGIDVAIPNGTPIYASHDGVVFEVDNNDDRDGLGIELFDEEQKIRTIYWHNQENLVVKDQRVKAGDMIAYSGATGKAYGSHLHFGLYETNEVGSILNYDNGYHGAIDPMPYFVFNMGLKFVRVKDGKDVWLVSRDNTRTLIYNQKAFTKIGDWADIKEITMAELETYPDTGLALAAIEQE